MYYPKLLPQAVSRQSIEVFAGYNHRLKIADGEFFNTKNLTTQYYPLFANRNKRGVLDNTFTKLQAIIAKDALYWVDNGTLYANGYPTGLTGLQTEHETQLVSMGAYICIFPDKKYINTQDLTDYGNMGAKWVYSGPVTYTMCNSNGEYYNNISKGATEPPDPTNGQIWIDTESGSTKRYSISTATWVVLETVYTRVDFTTKGQIGELFKELDGVEISGLYYDDLNGSKILYHIGGGGEVNDYVVLVGIQDEKTTHEGEMSIVREIPDMDFVCEAQNRLWGCFYGNDGTKNINEIYCCALGDFRNWSQYLGISTDSWRGSRGSDGPWTGCINYLGTPTFFKENVIHPVSVSPVGAHQIDDIPARGVQQGSHRSLAIVNETLYYKARTGIVAYQGGMPGDVSMALGEERYYKAAAGVFGYRYFISMQDSGGQWHLFCYDASKGLWMHEDDLHAELFARVDDELYCIADNRIVALNGTVGTPEKNVEWLAETGIQYYMTTDRKYVSRYSIMLKADLETRLQIYIEYDSSGVWTYAGEVLIETTSTITIPVRPRRCGHLRLRLEGRGNIRIFTISRLLQKGSDV